MLHEIIPNKPQCVLPLSPRLVGCSRGKIISCTPGPQAECSQTNKTLVVEVCWCKEYTLKDLVPGNQTVPLIITQTASLWPFQPLSQLWGTHETFRLIQWRARVNESISSKPKHFPNHIHVIVALKATHFFFWCYFVSFCAVCICHLVQFEPLPVVTLIRATEMGHALERYGLMMMTDLVAQVEGHAENGCCSGFESHISNRTENSSFICSHISVWENCNLCYISQNIQINPNEEWEDFSKPIIILLTFQRDSSCLQESILKGKKNLNVSSSSKSLRLHHTKLYIQTSGRVSGATVGQWVRRSTCGSVWGRSCTDQHQPTPNICWAWHARLTKWNIEKSRPHISLPYVCVRRWWVWDS